MKITIVRHYGAGPHKSGTPQSVHGRGGMSRWKEAEAVRQGKRAEYGSETVAFGQDPTERYTLKMRVVDLGSLIASNTAGGGPNPDYPAELQPRDRARLASVAQIDEMARQLVPEVLLLDFHQIDRGTPIIGPDRVVESGNGRALAMQRAAALYPEKWAEYQATLRKQLAANGLTEADIAGMKNPVLVRERSVDLDRAAFARKANQAAVLSMSPLEQAHVDAKRLGSEDLQRLTVGEAGSIDKALRAASNREFVKSFVAGMPANERALVMRGDGTLNQMGIWRIKAALFAKTFPGEAGQRLTETFFESLDSNIRNFESGLSGALPKVARAQGMLESGIREPALDMSRDFSKSLDILARCREQGVAVKDYVAQSSFLERELTPHQERLLVHMDKIGTSSKKIRGMFERYADIVDSQPDTRQVGLFGARPGITKAQLLDRLLTEEAE